MNLLKGLVAMIGLWGVADSVFLAGRPRAWAHWWVRYVALLGEQPPLAWLTALVEFSLSAGLLWWVFRPGAEARTGQGVAD